VWLHGDLHPANVVIRDGMHTGVIDFGEMGAGDPATVTRARGWAVLRALGLIGIGRNGRRGLPGGKPAWEPAGFATLERVLAAT
jgi:aminoglycoside phosphotransferase (APT) family kinase protein